MSYLQTIPSDITNLIHKFHQPTVVYHLVYEDSIKQRSVCRTLGIYLTLELAVNDMLRHLYTFDKHYPECRNVYDPKTKTWDYAYKKMTMHNMERTEEWPANWEDADYCRRNLRIDEVVLNTRCQEYDTTTYQIGGKKLTMCTMGPDTDSAPVEPVKWVPTEEFTHFKFYYEGEEYGDGEDEEEYNEDDE
jgi:hypothetical protein